MTVSRNLSALLAFTLWLVVTSLTPATAVVGSDRQSATACVSKGYVAGYAHVGDDLGSLPIDWTNEIHEQVCTTSDGLRYYRASANTPSEVSELVRMAVADAKPRSPIAVCHIGEHHARLVDLAFYYFASIKRMRAVERRTYADWVSAYAERRDCTLYK